MKNAPGGGIFGEEQKRNLGAHFYISNYNAKTLQAA